MGRVGLKPGIYPLLTSQKTHEFGLLAASSLPKDSILALSGNLGAGKTTFVQGLAEGLGISESIQSPTFILLNIYESLFHFDLYRLKDPSDFTKLGFEEYFTAGGICAIEWPERILDILPSQTIHIQFEYHEEGRIAKVY